MRLSSSSDVYRSHNDPKGKSKIVFGQESVSLKVHSKVKSKFYVGDKGLPTKVEQKGKSTDFVCGQNLSSHVVSQCKPKPKVSTSFTSTSHMAYRTRSKVPKLDDCMLLQEITPTENKQVRYCNHEIISDYINNHVSYCSTILSISFLHLVCAIQLCKLNQSLSH
ncbi:hypothetical protein Hanom_Chr10g00918651 [Helianthus anomalus]